MEGGEVCVYEKDTYTSFRERRAYLAERFQYATTLRFLATFYLSIKVYICSVKLPTEKIRCISLFSIPSKQ